MGMEIGLEKAGRKELCTAERKGRGLDASLSLTLTSPSDDQNKNWEVDMNSSEKF
jgi:hypothetical protein